MPRIAPILLVLVAVAASGLIYFMSQEKDLSGMSKVQRGRYLVEEKYGCRACHQIGNVLRAPALQPPTGKEVQLTDGRTVIFDEAYFRRAIMEPNAEVRVGYQPVMPSYASMIDEAQLSDILEYLNAQQP